MLNITVAYNKKGEAIYITNTVRDSYCSYLKTILDLSKRYVENQKTCPVKLWKRYLLALAEL